MHRFLTFTLIFRASRKVCKDHSTGIRNLNLNAYKEIQVPLPPLSEQKRIVKILDEVFEGIEKAKKNVEKNLKNSHELLNLIYRIFLRIMEVIGRRRFLKSSVRSHQIKRIYKKNMLNKGRNKERLEYLWQVILIDQLWNYRRDLCCKKDEKFYFKDGNVLWFKNFSYNSLFKYSAPIHHLGILTIYMKNI